MIQIIPCKDRIEELIQFITRLNSDGTHHIGFFGEGEADVRASLEECIIPTADGFMLAYENDQLVGVFGIDADSEINRAWLFGPLVENDGWHTVADKLYERVLSIIPTDIRDYDLFCDEQNVHLQEFAEQHGFPLRSQNAVMTLRRENYTPTAKNNSKIIPFDKNFFDQLEALHKTVFPNAYFTARQMIEKINETHQLFLALENEKVLGYHFCKIELEAESGYVDFIGTDSSVRGRGFGADLLKAGIDWILSSPSTKKINLTVNADNVPAISLYKKFGFITNRVMRGYRKQNIE